MSNLPADVNSFLKMTLPTKFIMCGVDHTLKYNGDIRGGRWYSNGAMEVGNCQSWDEFFQTLFHEILEGIMTSKFMRFTAYPEDYLFVFNHRDLCLIIQEFHSVVKQLNFVISDPE